MKKTLVITLAALLLLSVTACSNNGSETETGVETGTGIVFPVGTEGEGSTNSQDTGAETKAPGATVTTEAATEAPDDISEKDAEFQDIKATLYFWVGANIRSNTVLDADNIIGTVTEGSILTATGKSEKWYRVDYSGKVGYVSMTVAGDKAILDTFNDVTPEEVEITEDGVRVRTFPSVDGGQNTIIAKLNKGDKVTRIAVGDGWSRIQYVVLSESETGADGKPAKETKEYYVSSEYIKSEAATENATEAATEVVTEATTDAATEAATGNAEA